jgi:NAD-dependent SIR2 family protein deacetylase
VNLQPIQGKPFTFACIRCGGKTVSDAPGSMADLDGVPFRAWYCAKCAQVRRAERNAADIVRGPITAVEA